MQKILFPVSFSVDNFACVSLCVNGNRRVSFMLNQEMKMRYKSRIIIVDLPPMLVTDDVCEIMLSIDTMLFVVEEGKTKREEVTRCMTLLKDQNIIGTVLNKSKDKLSTYGYNTPYY